MIKANRTASPAALGALLEAYALLQQAQEILRVHHDEVYEELVALNQASAEVLRAAWEFRKRNVVPLPRKRNAS